MDSAMIKDIVVGVTSALAVIISDRQLIKWRLKGLERRVQRVEDVIFPPFNQGA